MVNRSDFLQRTPQLAAEGAGVLREVGWLSKTPEPFREAILGHAIWRIATPDAEFIHVGDPDGGLFAVARGLVEVSFVGHPDTRVINLVHPGFWGGYRPLIGRPRFGAFAARNEVLWALIPRSAVSRLLAENPGWWQHLVSLADDIFQSTAESVVDLTRQKSLQRAAAVLLRLAGVRHPCLAQPVEIGVSQADVAAMAVMSRGTFSTVLAQLVARGLVDVSYRSIRVLDADRLRAIVDAEG
jgi:CRP/FNR family transcriptional regulator, cyclic AMP receptor protein